MKLSTSNFVQHFRIVLVAFFVLSNCLRGHSCPQVPESNLPSNSKEPVHELKRPDPANVQKYLIKESPFGIPPEEAAHHHVMILEPDGCVATQVWIQSLPANKQATIDLSTFEQQASTRLEQLTPDGVLVLDLSQVEQTFLLKSEKGCILLSASRLLATDRVELLAWSKVRVAIEHRDKPIVNMKVVCGTALTSDMMYQVPHVSSSGVTDDAGVVDFTQLPPGELTIKVNPLTEQHQGKIWEWTDQTRRILSSPGAQSDIMIGKGARDVVGRFVFDREHDDGLQEFWGASLEYSSYQGNVGGNTETRVRIQIKKNGSFIAESAPPGEAKIIVQHPGLPGRRTILPQRVVLGPITIKEIGGKDEKDSDELQNLGELQLDFNASSNPLAVVQKNGLFGRAARLPSDDEFESHTDIAFVARVKRDGDFYHAFFGDQGQLIRIASECSRAIMIGKDAAIDTKNDRVYLLSDSTENVGQQELQAYDLTGRQLFTRRLKPGAFHGIAIDSENNRIGILETLSGTYTVQLLHSNGEQFLKSSFDSTQCICYSTADKAFWLSSYPLVLKLDPTTLQALIRFRITQSIRFSNLLPLKSGGVAAIEVARKDKLSSANRIWRIDSQAELIGRVDLGAYSISSCFELGSSLVAGSRKATSMLGEREPNTQFLVAADFKSMSRFDALADVSDGLDEAASIWVLDGNMLKRVTELDNELITTASRVNEEGIVFIVAE
jgi:hypothetical protein